MGGGVNCIGMYQYYEFCQLNSPISREARQEMMSLSSRAQINTHGASFVYNYGDFRGNPRQLLLKHFDVFFYISNWGALQLIFKYPDKYVSIVELKKYVIKDIICCTKYNHNILLDVSISNEEGGDWIDGEELLPDLLPLYKEIKIKNYQYLHLVSAINDVFTGKEQNAIDSMLSTVGLSPAQEAFLNCVSESHNVSS